MSQEWIIAQLQFPRELVLFMNETFEILEIRGLIEKVDGIRFFVHSNEKNHSIPHIHAEYGEYSISIRIDNGEVLAGNLPKKNQKFAQKWVLEHQDELNGIWKDQVIDAISHLTKSRIDDNKELTV